MKNFAKALFGMCLFCFSVLSFAVSADGVPDAKKTPQGLYLSAQESHDAIAKDPSKVLFVDVRSQAEVSFLGTAKGVDANVPYMDTTGFNEWDEKKLELKMEPSGSFVSDIKDRLAAKGLDKDAMVILMCRSGDRSSKAAALLLKAGGLTNVYTMVDGFEGDKAKDGESKGLRVVNGWKNSKLPWGYVADAKILTLRKR